MGCFFYLSLGPWVLVIIGIALSYLPRRALIGLFFLLKSMGLSFKFLDGDTYVQWSVNAKAQLDLTI
jgi:hypothetical protein